MKTKNIWETDKIHEHNYGNYTLVAKGDRDAAEKLVDEYNAKLAVLDAEYRAKLTAIVKGMKAPRNFPRTGGTVIVDTVEEIYNNGFRVFTEKGEGHFFFP